jgi:hypothetical protein
LEGREICSEWESLSLSFITIIISVEICTAFFLLLLYELKYYCEVFMGSCQKCVGFAYDDEWFDDDDGGGDVGIIIISKKKYYFV